MLRFRNYYSIILNGKNVYGGDTMKKKIFTGLLSLIVAFGACTVVSYGSYGIGMGCHAS